MLVQYMRMRKGRTVTTYTDEENLIVRFDAGQKTGAVWGPAVGDYWFAYRDDIAAGTLRFHDRESADKYLRAEVNR